MMDFDSWLTLPYKTPSGGLSAGFLLNLEDDNSWLTAKREEKTEDLCKQAFRGIKKNRSHRVLKLRGE